MKIFLLCIILYSLNGCTRVNRYLIKSYDIIYTYHLSLHELVYIINILNLKNHILVDLRPLEEYETAHIKGAVSIPLENISSLTNIEGIDTKKIIFYADKNPPIKKLMKKMKSITSNTNITFLKNGFRYWNGSMEGQNKDLKLKEHLENREKYDI